MRVIAAAKDCRYFQPLKNKPHVLQSKYPYEYENFDQHRIRLLMVIELVPSLWFCGWGIEDNIDTQTTLIVNTDTMNMSVTQ